jgi:hypothetical protein
MLSPTLHTCSSSTEDFESSLTLNKQNYVALVVREETIPTERPPSLSEVRANFLWIEGCRVVSAVDPLRP